MSRPLNPVTYPISSHNACPLHIFAMSSAAMSALDAAKVIPDESEKCPDPAEILPFLYLGSKNAAKNKGLLRKKNIKFILNCTPSREEDPLAGQPNFFAKVRTLVLCGVGGVGGDWPKWAEGHRLSGFRRY